MKAQSGKTPTEITSSPLSGFEHSVEPISRSSQSQIRQRCLERDGNRCVAAGYYNHSNAHPRNALTTYLEVSHIIPFTLGSFQADDGEIWVNLRRYFPILRSMSFTSEQINSEKNALILDSQLHRVFAQFKLIFEATGVAHQYRIKTFPGIATGPIQGLPRNRLVKFRVHKGSWEKGSWEKGSWEKGSWEKGSWEKGSWELPDPNLLKIHACIGNFLHISGQAKIIDKLLQRFEDCDGLAPSGSTNIEDLLAVSSLSLLPRKGSDPS